MSNPSHFEVALYAMATLIKYHVEDAPEHVYDWASKYLTAYATTYTLREQVDGLYETVQSEPMPTGGGDEQVTH